MSHKFNKKTRQIKAALALRGQTVKDWADEQALPITTVHQALHGTRAGKKSKAIRTQLEELIHV